MKDQALAERCRRIRLVLTDVDGVMTDGTILLLPGGQEGKSFHIRDGLGVVLAPPRGPADRHPLGPALGGDGPARRGAGDEGGPPGHAGQGGGAAARSCRSWVCSPTRSPTSATT